MICPKCNGEMVIASSFLQMVEKDGKNEICSVIDLMCTDPQCPDGKRRIPTARDTSPVTNDANQKNAVTCCGRPLIYVGDKDYWIPDGTASELLNNHEMNVTCGNCGSKHIVDVKNKKGA